MISFWPISRRRLSITQFDALNKQGCQQVFTDKVSGSNHPNPPLNNCLNICARRYGCRLEARRLGRNTEKRIKLVEELAERKQT